MTDKVLIVDDEEDLLYCFRHFLENAGFECATASDGGEALQILQEQSFDIILSDICMPGMDGIEFLAKALELKRHSLFFFMTGFSQISEQNLLNLGAHRVYKKPIDFKDLVSDLKSAIQNYTKA